MNLHPAPVDRRDPLEAGGATEMNAKQKYEGSMKATDEFDGIQNDMTDVGTHNASEDIQRRIDAERLAAAELVAEMEKVIKASSTLAEAVAAYGKALQGRDEMAKGHAALAVADALGGYYVAKKELDK